MPRQNGAIAAGHQRTALAGARMLAEGGNAVDAAVAAVFAACTCEPTLTGPGGAGFATVRLADGSDFVLDFFAAVPGKARTVDTATGPVPVDVLFGSTTQTFHVGPQSCAVPGLVKGTLELHERFGRLPRRTVLEPGIELARTGLDLEPEQAYCHSLLENIVTRRSAGREVFAPEGEFLGAGAHFAQPRLADMLEVLAQEGADCFYTGDIGAEIVRWADEHGGLITREDLADYVVRELRPGRSSYRGLQFLSVPPPSSGGALVAYALRILDEARQEGPIDADEPAGAELLVRAMQAANSVRGAEFDRYLYGDGLVEWLLSDDVVGRGLAVARNGLAAAGDHPGSRLGSTTHASVIDAEGNAVAITTSTGCGSGEFVSDTGIHLNNMLGEEDLVPVEHQLVPGDRLTSMMAPSLLLRDGSPLLATGSAGSNRLRSAIVQTLVRVVESRYVGGGSLQERLRATVGASRLHPESGLLHVEPGIDAAVLEHLHSIGHKLNQWPARNMYFGGVNMVAVDADGSFAAAGDPRRGGGGAVGMSDGSVVLR